MRRLELGFSLVLGALVPERTRGSHGFMGSRFVDGVVGNSESAVLGIACLVIVTPRQGAWAGIERACASGDSGTPQ